MQVMKMNEEGNDKHDHNLGLCNEGRGRVEENESVASVFMASVFVESFAEKPRKNKRFIKFLQSVPMFTVLQIGSPVTSAGLLASMHLLCFLHLNMKMESLFVFLFFVDQIA